MTRSIMGVVLGYLAMFIVVFTSMAAAFTGLGNDRAFAPGTFEPSALWITTSLLIGIVGALAGGWVCAAVARRAKAVRAFAGIALALGLAMAVPAMTASPAPGDRAAQIGTMEAMQQTQTPLWVALLNPLIAVAGISLGGRRRLGTT